MKIMKYCIAIFAIVTLCCACEAQQSNDVAPSPDEFISWSPVPVQSFSNDLPTDLQKSPTAPVPSDAVIVWEVPAYITPSFVPLSEFDMDYSLLTETFFPNDQISLGYWRDYAIIGSDTNNYSDAVNKYITVQNALLCAGYPWSQNILDRVKNREMIFRLLPDLSSYLTFTETGDQEHILRCYRNNQLVNESVGIYRAMDFLTDCVHELDEAKIIDVISSDIIELPKWNNDKYHYYGFHNFYGNIFAIESDDYNSIDIYRIGEPHPLFSIPLDGVTDFPVPYRRFEISQVSGNEKSGFVLFSSSVRTYKLDYPNGKLAVLGDYKFNATLSPNGNFLAYTSLFDQDWESTVEGLNSNGKPTNEFYAAIETNLMTMPRGWYIEELKSGKTAFISPDEIEPRFSVESACHELTPIVWIDNHSLNGLIR